MQVVILSASHGWHVHELCRALTERGHLALVLPYAGLVARLGVPGASDEPMRSPRSSGHGLMCEATPILDADAVLARTIPGGSLEQVIFRVNALHWIERHGVPVTNSPRAIERTVDKFFTHALLQEEGLPTPETIVCEHAEHAMAAVQEMRDVVIKPIFGSMGHGLVRVSDPDLAFRVVRALEQVRSVFYVQRAIDHGGRDIRVFVIGGRVFGAIERLAPAGDWRSNTSRGGSARAFDLPSEWAQLALRATAAVGADYAGVDLLPSRDGTVFVLEVNGVPGWQGLQRATGLDVAGAIVNYVTDGLPAAQVAASATGG